jgi:hypothetical protein
MSERWLWTQKEDIGPTSRVNAAMAYEAARQRVVLVGGRGNDGYFNDTWEWDGDAWTQVADMGPAPRRSCGMTYEESRQRLVLFGGEVMRSTQVNEPNGETWEWNGSEWTQVADIGPAPRYGCAMTYDTVRHRVVLFGGYSYLPQPTYFDDTWEWDGTEWTQIADTGPSGRGLLPMVFDSSRECLVLFGGHSGLPTGWRSDTWEWSEDTGWVERQDMGPQSISYPTMARTQERTVLHGFPSEATGAMQTWEWDGRLWTQRQDMGPSVRYGHALAYDSERDRVVLFGGYAFLPPGGYLSDTWELAIIEQ